jgi:glucans biosynthesis protein
VFLRDQVSRLGIAPLTSMYLFGANQPSKVLNYRPALHDSKACRSMPATASGSGAR